MEKKTGIILGILAIVVVGIAFFTSNTGDTKEVKQYTPEEIMKRAQNEASAISSNERANLITIDVDKYLNLYSGEENSLVFIGTGDCPYCAIARPIIENFAYKYKLSIYYLNTGEFDVDAQNKFVNSDEYFESGFGVPMLLYVGDGKIIDMVDGLYDTEHYLEFFKENKLVIE